MSQVDKHESSGPASSQPARAQESQTAWQREVLYHHRMRTRLSNERKYLGWLRVCLGMITLGFVVERLGLFLAQLQGTIAQDLPNLLLWAPLAIYSMGAVTIGVATWEFFADRRRITQREHHESRLLFALILLLFVFVLTIAFILWVPDLPIANM